MDIPLFMMSSVPCSPGPFMDTSIFSMRGYRPLCRACSLEKTSLRWLRTSAAAGRTAAAAVDENPSENERTTKNSGWKKLYKKLNIIKTSVKYTNVSTFCFDTFYNLKVNKTDTFLTEVINDSDS